MTSEEYRAAYNAAEEASLVDFNAFIDEHRTLMESDLEWKRNYPELATKFHHLLYLQVREMDKFKARADVRAYIRSLQPDACAKKPAPKAGEEQLKLFS